MDRKTDKESQKEEKTQEHPYKIDAADKAEDKNQEESAEVTWTASEYIAHHKGFGWYVLLILAALALTALVYWLTDDIISTAAVLILIVIFATAAGFKPRVLTYQLSASGLTIGKRFYPYGNFKYFTVARQGAIPSITFMPLKRFMPSISIYFAPDDQEKIVGALSKHLPEQQAKGELVDRMMHRIRF